MEADDERRSDRIVMPQAMRAQWAMSGNRFWEESVVTFPTRSEAEEAGGRAMDKPARGSGPGSPSLPSGDERQTVVFDGAKGLLTRYDQGGRRTISQRLDGEEGAAQAAAACAFLRWLGTPVLRPRLKAPATIPTEHDDPLIAGTEDVSGIPCIKLIGRRPRGSFAYTWWIAPEHDFLAMRIDQVTIGPSAGVGPGQHLVVRRRVKRIQSFDGDIHLPVVVEKTTAKVNADGTIARVYRRERFTATQVQVNQPVADATFRVPESEPDRISRGDQQPPVGGCGYHATLEDLSALDQPAIAHVLALDEIGHFVAIESVAAGLARILDGGEMDITSIDELKGCFAGVILAVDPEQISSERRQGPRVLCETSIQRPQPSQLAEYQFAVSNVGTDTLRLEHSGALPDGAPVKVRVPAEIAAGCSADVVVHYDTAEMAEPAWAVQVRTNDLLRPVLWLGSGTA
jgi:hypothetical protein